MPQQSKLLISRDNWKDKAIHRAIEIQELKKTKNRLKGKVAELKRSNKIANHNKKNS